jgi:toxin ParE1/3/4
MSNICKFTVPASRDIESIIDYVADNSSFDAAESLLSKINSKCERLAKFPSMGRSRDELATNVRSFPVRDFQIKKCPKTDAEILSLCTLCLCGSFLRIIYFLEVS